MTTTRTIDVDFDIDRFRREASSIMRRQVPFATAQAINDTIAEARTTLIEALPGHFTIRRPHAARGFLREFARKRDRPIQGAVGTTRDYMVTQIEGGKRTPDEGRTVGIPVAARRSPRSVITPARFPGAFLAKPGAFVGGTKRDARGRLVPKGGTEALFVPIGRRRRKAGKKRRRKKRPTKASRRRLRIMYYLRPSVDVPARFPFFEISEGVFSREWAIHMRRAWDHALRTAR